MFLGNYIVILVGTICRKTEGLIADKKGGFRADMGYVGEILILK